MYLEEMIKQLEENVDSEMNLTTKKMIENAKGLLAELKFIEQKWVRSIVDQVTRVGHNRFFGYKVKYMMTDERIITAV